MVERTLKRTLERILERTFERTFEWTFERAVKWTLDLIGTDVGMDLGWIRDGIPGLARTRNGP